MCLCMYICMHINTYLDVKIKYNDLSKSIPDIIYLIIANLLFHTLKVSLFSF